MTFNRKGAKALSILRQAPFKKLNFSRYKKGGAILLLPFIIFSSCKDKTVVVPEAVLSSDSLTAVMVDIQLVEAMKIKKGINDSLKKDSLLNLYAVILKKHGILQEQFEQSLSFYKEHPELLEEVYDKTINELSRLQATVGAISNAAADSARNNKAPLPGKTPVQDKSKQ